MNTAEIEADIAAYTAGMMANDVDRMLKIERRYNAEGYDPARVSEVMADWLDESKIVMPELDPRLVELDWREYGGGDPDAEGPDGEKAATTIGDFLCAYDMFSRKRYALGYQAPGYEMVGYHSIANYWTEAACKAKAVEMYQRMAGGVITNVPSGYVTAAALEAFKRDQSSMTIWHTRHRDDFIRVPVWIGRPAPPISFAGPIDDRTPF